MEPDTIKPIPPFPTPPGTPEPPQPATEIPINTINPHPIAPARPPSIGGRFYAWLRSIF